MYADRTFSVTVQSASSTVAETIAQNLLTEFPTTPAWSSELSSPAYLANGQINVAIPARGTVGPSNFQAFNAPNAGATQTSLYWTGKAQWRSANGGEWWFCGGTTGSWPGSMNLVRYSVANDAFQHWQGDYREDTTTSCFDTYGAPHNFDGACIDPVGGKIYRYCAHENGTTSANWTLGEWDCDGLTGRAIASSNGYGADDYRSCEWFPEINKVVIRRNLGASTSFPWGTFEPSSGTFGTITNSKLWADPALCYHSGYVYLTSGNTPCTFHRLRPDGGVDDLASPPVQMNGRSDTVATHTILCSLGANIYAFVNRTVYRYSPSGGSWVSYDAFPWSPVANDAHFTVGPLRLSSGDVAMFVRSLADTVHEALIWKP